MKEDAIESLLEGMPQPKRQKRVVRKKHFSTKNLPLDVAVRRLVAEEIGDVDPTRDEKFILLQKYGVVAPRIDRSVKKPKWMGESEWKRKLNNWFKMTQGLVRRFQNPKSRPQQTQPTGRPNQRPWKHSKRNQTTVSTRQNFGPTRTGNSQR